MINQVTIHIDDNSKQLLKKQIGKKLIRIGYVLKKDFSLATALIFENCTLKICNFPISAGSYNEEYPHISVKYITISNDIAYGNEKYEYFDVDMIVTSCKIMSDHIAWPDNDSLDIENAIVLESDKKKSIILYAMDSGAGTIIIFDNKEDFEKKIPIKEMWADKNDTNIVCKRSFKNI